MNNLFNTPLEQFLNTFWRNIDANFKKSFLIIFAINILAFGFEMTNLTLHHDDVSQFFVQDSLFGRHVGRFGLGWLYYYGQSGYFMPFLQMTVGITLMIAYAILISHLWNLKKPFEIIIIASTISVFPYMAHVYQFNTAMLAYPLAHFLVALAIYHSNKQTVINLIIASFCYCIAFSIYQAVFSNAITIFTWWVLFQLLFKTNTIKALIPPSAFFLLSLAIGGTVYLIALLVLDIELSSYASADKIFTIGEGVKYNFVFLDVLKGTRAFYFWPENYFPNYIKKLQLIIIIGAIGSCALMLAKRNNKSLIIGLLILAYITPRSMQLIHPHYDYRDLTLTAYAISIAGSLVIINKAKNIVCRNIANLIAIIMIWSYLIQCNWISTVNHFNNIAHFSIITEVLSRAGTAQNKSWDGKTIVVDGKYKMLRSHPYIKAGAVSNDFIDEEHMQSLVTLLRRDISIVSIGNSDLDFQKLAQSLPIWPASGSLVIKDGIALVKMSN